MVGGVRTTISTSELRISQKRIEVEEQNRKGVQAKREVAADSLQSIQLKILDVESSEGVSSELGPLEYLSGLLDKPMDVIINWFILIIIFVFDPLAISLVIASNFMFNQLKGKNENEDTEKDNLAGDPIDISKEAGKIEKELLSDEPKPLEVSDELLRRLEKELGKIDTKETENEKSMVITDDLLKKIDKLSQVIDLESDVEEQSENIEKKENNKVTPQPNKRILTYRKRDADEWDVWNGDYEE